MGERRKEIKIDRNEEKWKNERKGSVPTKES